MYRVLLVGDDPFARTGLAAAIADRFDVVGELPADGDLVVATATLHPDGVLWDLLGHTLRPGRLEDVPAPVLALASDESEAASAMAAGVQGVLARTLDPDRIAVALDAVCTGLTVIDAPFTESLVRAVTPEALQEPLTDRELDVLELVAEGLSNKQVGAALDISEHTARFHLVAVLAKLGARNRTDAVVKAARLGLLSI